MSLISLIAIMDNNRGIGYQNRLPWYLPADLAYFKDTTWGKPIIMGKNTYDSLGRPLPGRTNIVITRNELNIPNVTGFPSLLSALNHYATVPEIMIIGGEQLFQSALPLADRLYLTRVDGIFKADVFFPKLPSDEWEQASNSFRAKDEKNPYDLYITLYKKIGRKLE